MSKLTKSIGLFMNKNGSKILIVTSIAAMGSSIVMAVKSTPKYQLLIEERKEEKGEDLTKKEKIKPLFKAYWPSILLAVFSAACTVGSHVIEKKHQAVLATALAASNTALKEFQDKALEHLGEKKVTEIKEAIDKDKLDKNKIETTKIIPEPGSKKYLMFDSFSGRYFYSNIETYIKAANKIDKQIRDENYCSVNEFYIEADLPEIDMGNDFGWYVESSNFKELKVRISSHPTESGESCTVVTFDPVPEPVAWFRD